MLGRDFEHRRFSLSELHGQFTTMICHFRVHSCFLVNLTTTIGLQIEGYIAAYCSSPCLKPSKGSSTPRNAAC